MSDDSRGSGPGQRTIVATAMVAAVVVGAAGYTLGRTSGCCASSPATTSAEAGFARDLMDPIADALDPARAEHRALLAFSFLDEINHNVLHTFLPDLYRTASNLTHSDNMGVPLE